MGQGEYTPPVMVWMSDPQTPQHSMAMSTSWSSKVLSLYWEDVSLFLDGERELNSSSVPLAWRTYPIASGPGP